MATKVSRESKSLLSLSSVRSAAWLGVCLLAACSDMNPTGPESGAGAGTGTGSGAESGPRPGTPPAPSSHNPIAGARLYVEPSNNALRTAEQWRTTRPADADLMERIGRTAQAVWFNGWHSDVAAGAASYVSAASSAGALPVLVAYNIPQRDCGSYSAGGSESADAYRAWMRDLARGIGSRRALVILEPDALAGMNCLSTTDRERRVQLLRDAIAILKANGGTIVYLDAGHARWISSGEMAKRLTAANIAAADGFALNVSNYVWSSENVAYGEAVSGLAGGKHFVIDTSRNGQGPTASNEWCNPSGRGLGARPTTATGHPLVDAVLWIKRPGESDGSCNGGPNSGKWWPEYALGLAQRATTQLALN
ncbi:MAG: glycoside hydrolase family 6 protein [Gemmatimonadota bacterium]